MFPMIPTYLTPIQHYPDYYHDIVRCQVVHLTPAFVNHLYWQEQQAQVQPAFHNIHHNANVNISVMQHGSQQVTGNNNNLGNHQQALWVPQQRPQIPFTGYNASQMHPVQPVSQAQPAPVTTSNNTIDLTDDSVASAPVLTPNPTAPAPIAKRGPSAWARCKKHLETLFASGSDESRLYESMESTLTSSQRNKYCNVHWHTDQAARENIVDMSKYFIDAVEMLMYAQKWDRLVNAPDPEEASITADKNRLKTELPNKREIKIAKVEHAQWCQWVKKMKGEEFERRFSVRKTAAAVAEKIRKKEEELDKELKEILDGPSKKRQAEKAPAATRAGKKSKIGTAAQEKPALIDIPKNLEPSQGITKDEVPELLSTFDLELIDMMNESFGGADSATSAASADAEVHPSPPSSPVFTDLEIKTPADEGYHSPPTEKPSEHVTAPVFLQTLALREDNTVIAKAKVTEDLQAPVRDETFLEQVTAPITPTVSPREEDTVVVTRQKVFEDLPAPLKEDARTEQVTAPVTPAPTPQEEITAAVVKEMDEGDVDGLFEDAGDVVEHENVSPTTDMEVVEEQIPAPVIEQAAADLPQEEDIEESTASAEAREAAAHHNELLAKKLKEIHELEESIVFIRTHRNAMFKRRLEDLCSRDEAKLQALKDQLEVLENLSAQEKLEMWQQTEVVQQRRRYAARKAAAAVEKKKEAVSCGGSRIKY